jgi:hypothetical protein
VQGGLPPYTYLWTDSTPATLAALNTGNPGFTAPATPKATLHFSVLVTDSLGNEARDSIVYTIDNPPAPPMPTSLDLLSANPKLTGLSGVAANYSLHAPVIVGGTPPYTYLWSLGAQTHGLTLTDAATANPTLAMPAVASTCASISGKISLTVTDSAGQQARASLDYSNNPAVDPTQPVSCHLCRGPKFICERAHAPQRCARKEHQYCINDVENLQDGSRYVTRRCATAEEVNKDWIAETADRNECSQYSVDSLQAAHFSCAFACKGDDCNGETVPKDLVKAAVPVPSDAGTACP